MTSWVTSYETRSVLTIFTSHVQVTAREYGAGQFGEAMEPMSPVSNPPQTSVTKEKIEAIKCNIMDGVLNSSN